MSTGYYLYAVPFGSTNNDPWVRFFPKQQFAVDAANPVASFTGILASDLKTPTLAVPGAISSWQGLYAVSSVTDIRVSRKTQTSRPPFQKRARNGSAV